MKKRHRQKVSVGLLVSLVIGFMLAATSGPALAQVQREQATVTIVVGTVEVLTAGTTAWRRAAVGMKLAQGDEIRAAANAEAELQMTDGSVIKVTARTRLQVSQLDFDPTTRVRNSFFHLVAGRIRAVVAQAAVALVAAREGGFVITTPTAVAAVRGSDAVIAYNPATQASTIVPFRGVWAAMEPTTQRVALVTQGNGSQVTPGAPPTTPVPVPANVQAAILINTAIVTAAPAAAPVISPVAAGASAAAVAAPGAPAVAPPAPPPPTVEALVAAAVPPSRPPGAPPPPAAQAPVIPPAITDIPTARPPTPAVTAATTTALVTPTAALAAPPPITVVVAAIAVEVSPALAAVPPPGPPPPVVVVAAPPPLPDVPAAPPAPGPGVVPPGFVPPPFLERPVSPVR